MKRMWSKNEIKQQNIELLGSGQVPSVKANEIIENMSGYSAELVTNTTWDFENVYTGVVKNGNKLTIVTCVNIIAKQNSPHDQFSLIDFTLPQDVYDKLYPTSIGGAQLLSNTIVYGVKSTSYSTVISLQAYSQKLTDNKINFALKNINTSFSANDKYFVRIEQTFLLSDNLIPTT